MNRFEEPGPGLNAHGDFERDGHRIAYRIDDGTITYLQVWDVETGTKQEPTYEIEEEVWKDAVA